MIKLSQAQLQQMKTLLDQMRQLGMVIPPEFNSPDVDPQLVVNYLQSLLDVLEQGKATFDELLRSTQQQLTQRVNVVNQMQAIKQQTTANIKPFNAKKFAQLNSIPGTDMPMDEVPVPNQADQGLEQPLSNPLEGEATSVGQDLNQGQQSSDLTQMNFGSIVDFVKNYLEKKDETNARAEVLDYVGKENEETVASILQSFYETDWTQADDAETKKLILVKPIWDALPSAVKQDQAKQGVIENAKFETTDGKENIVAFVSETNEQIKKLAQESVDNSIKPFNVKKFAQAKTTENIIMYGPSEKRFDAFLRQPISDWHIVERNKGFGLVVDDVWNIDWEAIWRGNIMDKYSRPYRDSKTGEWIGGYIQKRFEVDKWIPEGNNYQLLPGQRRRPFIAERSSTEARLEAMREKEASERGYEPVSEGKPFNWKKAMEAKAKKIAEAEESKKKS